MEDFTGQTISLIKVLGINEQASEKKSAQKGKKVRVYDCECLKCHKILQIEHVTLISKRLAYRKNPKQEKGCVECNKRDLTGKRFYRLVVKGLDIEKTKEYGHRMWICQCDCGNTITVAGNHLGSLTKPTKSCGCLQKEVNKVTQRKRARWDGDSKKEEYKRLIRIWQNMHDRCKNPKNTMYKHYGQRGITICTEWSDWNIFKEWAFNTGYNDELTIDRIDVNGNYEPSNCRWADRIQQQNNTRNNRYLTYNGETHTIAEWARIKGMYYNTLYYRLFHAKQTFSIEEALNPTLRKTKL